MDPIFMGGWLLRQAVKLVVIPVGQSGLDEFCNEIGRRLGKGAADFAADWMRSVTAPRSMAAGTTIRALVADMQAQPQVASALGEVVGERLGVKLSSTELVPTGSPDVVAVDAYSALLWRLSVLAFAENRPIAVHGALQGGDWVTVANPQPGLGLTTPKPPEEHEVFWRWDPRMLRRPDAWGRTDFFVKRAADPQDEVEELEREFRRSPDDAFSPDAPVESLPDRWLRMEGVGSLWVQLEPDPAATAWMIAQGVRSDALRYPEYKMYPPEWRPLLDITDEIEGLRALDDGTDEFAAKSSALVTRIRNN